jgi:hypothetical protein
MCANHGPVSIECSKDQVKFTCAGDIGSGSVILKPNENLDKPGENVTIEMSEPVALTFSLKYLTNFCKASGLSDSVKLCLSSEVPLLVEYTLQSNSYLRFYLAPKARFYPSLYLSTSDLCRLATRSKRIMTSFTRAACFQNRCGGFAAQWLCMHIERLLGYGSGVLHWRATRITLVFCARGTKERSPPHQHFTSSRGTSDKEINTVQPEYNIPACCSPVFIASFTLTITLYDAIMASDTLIPDTRVLAIASHVRLIRVENGACS